MFEASAQKIPFDPNVITLLSLVAVAIGTYFIYAGSIPLAILFVALAFAFDGLDGLVARAQRKVTKFGAYLDGIADRLVEMFVLVAMMHLVWPASEIALFSLIMLLSFGTFLTSFAKAYADHRKAITDRKLLDKMDCVFERTERAILIFISLILYMYSPIYSQYLLLLGAILSLIAFLQRFVFVFEHSA